MNQGGRVVVRRPVVGIAIAMVFGMVNAAYGVLSVELFFLLTLLCIFCLYRFRKSTAFLFVFIALVSGCYYLVSTPGARSDSLINTEELWLGKNHKLVGRVSGFPKFYAYRDGRFGVWTFPVACEGVFVRDQWLRVSGDIDVRVSGATKSGVAALGERVLVQGVSKRKTFSGVSPYEVECDRYSLPKSLSVPRCFNFKIWGKRVRDVVAEPLGSGIQRFPEQLAVLRALVLGFREEIPINRSAQFRRTGTVHIFAISGLHVGIVGLLLMAVLKMFGVPLDRFAYFLIPLLAVYVISTGMKSSALRALTMAGVFIVSPCVRRNPDVPSSVAFSAILLLVIQPSEILSVGFMYSFIVVVFLVMIFSVVPEHWLKRSRGINYVQSLVITSFAAGLASAPLTALFFGSFSPVSLVGNLVVVPLTFCIVLCGWLSIVFTFVSSAFNHASVVLIDLLLGWVTLLNRMPGAGVSVEPPPIIAILLWYGSLICLFTHSRSLLQRIYSVAGVVCAVLLVLMC